MWLDQSTYLIIVETSYKWTKEALLAMNEAQSEGDQAAAEARQLSGHRRLSGALLATVAKKQLRAWVPRALALLLCTILARRSCRVVLLWLANYVETVVAEP